MDNIDIEHIQTTKWYRQGAAARPYYFFPAFGAADVVLGRKNVIIQQEGELHHAYFNSDVEYSVAMHDIEEQKKNGNYIQNMINSWCAINKKIDEFIPTIDFSNLSLLSNNELLNVYKKLSDFDCERWLTAIHIECFDPWSDTIITNELHKYSVDIADNDLEILFSPEQLLFSQEEELSLYIISQSSEFGKEKLLEKHQQKFFWIQNDWANLTILDINFFKKRVEEISHISAEDIQERIDNLQRHEVTILKKKKFLIDKYNLEHELLNIFNFFSKMTIWRDERKKRILQYNNYYHICAQEFSRRTGISLEQITFLRADELIESKLDFTDNFKKSLSSRAQHCFYHVDIEGDQVILIDDDYWSFRRIIEKTFNKQFTQLKGMVAQKGITTGHVKIVNVPNDFPKMQAGDILVAPMTRPEYLPLMKKAAAIVTDEGGITCHAAIVSRELGVPCIIGTQVATEVLKDGDVVEVDAERGVVRKIM